MEQIELLEHHGAESRCRHVEASLPGELLNQGTFFLGTLEGIGKVYVQVVVDVFCSLASAKVYNSKMPVTACDLLYDRGLPCYEQLGISVRAILSANRPMVPCGKPPAGRTHRVAIRAREAAGNRMGTSGRPPPLSPG